MFTDILDQYAGLLIVQYKNKTKAIETVRLFANSSVCDGLPLALQTCFNLDTAFGNQLTIIGKIVGVPRNVKGLNLNYNFFNFTDYNGSPASNGFMDYANAPDTSALRLLDYNDSFSYTMTDADMRTVIYLAIIGNSSALTFKDIKTKLWNYFQGGIDIGPAPDNSNTYFNFTDFNGSPASNGFQDYLSQPDTSGIKFFDYGNYHIMELNYFVNTSYTTAIIVAQLLDILPRPFAVKANVYYK